MTDDTWDNVCLCLFFVFVVLILAALVLGGKTCGLFPY